MAHDTSFGAHRVCYRATLHATRPFWYDRRLLQSNDKRRYPRRRWKLFRGLFAFPRRIIDPGPRAPQGLIVPFQTAVQIDELDSETQVLSPEPRVPHWLTVPFLALDVGFIRLPCHSIRYRKSPVSGIWLRCLVYIHNTSVCIIHTDIIKDM